MLTYYYNPSIHKSKYKFLYLAIKEDILNGKLLPNEQLPSKRNFAKHLGMSHITIENAYNQLIIEGYIYSIEKKGYFVSELIQHFINKPSEFIYEKIEEERYIIDLKTTSVSFETFPYNTWTKLTREVLQNHPKNVLRRCEHRGTTELITAIAYHLKSFYNMDVHPSQIVVGAGTEYLYSMLIQLFMHDKIYALEDPTHVSISNIYQRNSIKTKHIPLDDCGIKVINLEKSKANIVHVSPAHQYPTGITMPISRRLELLNWAQNNDGYIIEDDYDSEFRLDGSPIPSLFQTDNNQRVIYINTFSKTLSPSFRISYLILPLSLIDKYQNAYNSYACSVSTFDQLILARFIQDNYFERHLQRTKKYYLTLRDKLLELLTTSKYSNQFTIKEENSGLHFLLTYNSKKSDDEVIKIAKSIGIKVETLSHYYQSKTNMNTLVVNYSGLSLDQVEDASLLIFKLLQCIN